MTTTPSREPFTSALAEPITSYLRLKQALGRRYAVERAILRALDAFLTDAHGDLTADTFAAWNATLTHLSAGVRRNWLRVARNLCLYRCRTCPSAFVPDATAFPRPHLPVRPHIFTDREIVRLVHAADHLSPTPVSPTRATVFRLALVLLYTTGLRRGELLRLTVGDYHADEQLLGVRETKFHKSRLVPLSADGRDALDAALLVHRQHGFPFTAHTPLIWNRSRVGGRSYTGVGLGAGFRALCTHAEIQTSTGARPRLHDLRHTFAVHALLRWYRAGVDPQAKLPFLAAYMGHISPISTAYYLPFVPALAEVASARFLIGAGDVVTTLVPDGDRP